MSEPVNKQEKINPSPYLNTEDQNRKYGIVMYLNSKNPNACQNKDVSAISNIKPQACTLCHLSWPRCKQRRPLQPKQCNINDGDHLNKEKITLIGAEKEKEILLILQGRSHGFEGMG